MRRRRITEITIETDRTLFISRGERSGWCAECGAEVELLNAFEAAARHGISSHTVYGLAEAGALHSRLTPGGVLLVCAGSLGAVRGEG